MSSITYEEQGAIQDSMQYIMARKDAMSSLFDNFGSSVNDVYNQSNGKYAESYKQEYDTLKPVFAKFDNVMNQMSKDLGITIEKTNETDASLAGKTDALNDVR